MTKSISISVRLDALMIQLDDEIQTEVMDILTEYHFERNRGSISKKVLKIPEYKQIRLSVVNNKSKTITYEIYTPTYNTNNPISA